MKEQSEESEFSSEDEFPPKKKGRTELASIITKEKFKVALGLLLNNRERRARQCGRALLMEMADDCVREAHELGKECSERSISFSTLAKSKKDSAALRAMQALPFAVESRRRFDPKRAAAMVTFILGPQCVRLVSWCDRKISTGDVIHVVPGLMRCGTINMLYDRYVAYCLSQGVENLKRTSFQKVVKALTVCNSGSVQSLSYVYVERVRHVHDTLLALVDDFSESVEAAAQMKRKLEVTTACLKTCTDLDTSLCPSPESCAVHNSKYALGQWNSEPAIGPLGPCGMIGKIFETWNDMYNMVERSSRHRELLRKAKLVLLRNRNLWFEYIAHLVRCRHQKEFLAGLHDLHIADPKVAVCILDFKMKLETRKFREDQRDHFGKRGMSFHGVAMHYMHTWFYFAQFAGNSSKQDVGMTASMVESFLHQIRDIMAFDRIERVILQSDQARNYGSPNLLYAIAAMNRLNSERELNLPHVDMLVHSEVQEGHGFCDSFFAVAGSAIRRIVDEGNTELQLRTPKDAVNILHTAISRGSLNRTTAELVDIDLTLARRLQQGLRGAAKGTYMQAEFGHTSEEFAIVCRRLSADPMFDKFAVRYTEALQPATHEAETADKDESRLPFSQARRSKSMAAMIADLDPNESGKGPSQSRVLPGQKRDVISYCTEEGVRRIEHGEIQTITRHNCHRILAGLEKDEGVDMNPCVAVELHEGHAIEEIADDEEDADEEQESLDADELGPQSPPGNPIDPAAFLAARFQYGWARRQPRSHAKRGRPTKDEGENDELDLELGPIDAQVRRILHEFFEEGASGHKVSGGEAIERLLTHHSMRLWMLPTDTTINAFMSSQKACRKAVPTAEIR